MVINSEAGPSDAAVTKHIFVTGGVVSSLGKGLTAASLGNLLTARGLRVVMQKLDPYLNVDPGTMNPFQHGEVFVTDDGAETDLDIGHYERFLDIDLDQAANVTTGQIYSTVIARERRGEYLGDTVQVIPHITDEIKRRMRLQAQGPFDDANPRPDVIITEIGGTVGDIESQPFIESARQVRHELGRKNVFFVHVSLVPYMGASGEQKTKPTQHSVAALRSIGIQPDALVLRSDRPVSESNKRKIALMCDVDEAAVVNAVDVPSIYDIPDDAARPGPRRLHHRPARPRGRRRGVGRLERPAHRRARPEAHRDDRPGRQVHRPARCVPVGDRGAQGGWIRAPGEGRRALDRLRRVPDARGSCANARRISTAFSFRAGSACAASRASSVRSSSLARTASRCSGICLGLQCMVIEYARDVAGLTNASSSEFDPDTQYPVIATMAEQVDIIDHGDLGGTMRLGLYEADLAPGSIVAELYGAPRAAERHRHRYEVNNAYRGQLAEAGLVFSGLSPDRNLVEYVELPREVHPFYVGTQAHPELRSRPNHAHPLFRGLIWAALERQQASRLFEVPEPAGA